MKGLFIIYDTADAKTKPLDSTAAILSTLNFLVFSVIWSIHSLKAFSFLLM